MRSKHREVKKTQMRNKGLVYILILCLFASFAMAGCDDEDKDAASGTEDLTGTTDADREGYDNYIRSVLDGVNDPAQSVKTDRTGTDTPAKSDTSGGNSIQIDKTAPDDTYISSMDSTDTDGYDPFATPIPGYEDSPTPTIDPNASPTPTPTPYITPEEFDVGVCCIYINGESDSAYGTELITAINKARTDLGYKPLITNKSLSTCADRRTREIAASFNHTRPNGTAFYSVAPEHFKAEMLIKNNQKADEAVDAMIKNDPISRNLIFTTKYQSIGASSFKCNGMKYSVVSFGL